MKRVTKRIFSLMLVFCMVMALAPNVYGASSTIPVKVTTSFKNSTYYTKANAAYTKYLNASDAERFVRVALSQKGYKGSKKNGVYDGKGTTRGKYTEYSKWAGVNGRDWCASFVSWAAAAAGISKNVIPRNTVCKYWQNTSPNGGTFHKLWSSDFKKYNDYKPQIGDIALYTPTCDTCKKHYDSYIKSAHAVIVVDVADKKNKDGSWTFTTIERSDNNIVASNTVTTKQTRGSLGTCTCEKQKKKGKYAYVVQGFFHPNWADGKSAPAHLDSSSSQTSTKPSTTTPSNNTTTSGTVTVKYPTNPTYLAKFSYTSNNAVLVANITKPSGSTVNYVGMALYCNNTLVCNKAFTVSNVSKTTTSFHAWFDVQKELGVTLKPGTTYQYKIYAKIDDVLYSGNLYSFATKAATSTTPTTPTVTTYVGYIKGTDGSLAINSTPKVGNQIGAIPECAPCTVYPDKKSGNWVWVSYNGVSGYAYSTYITKTKPASKAGTVKGTDGSLVINRIPKVGYQIGLIPEGKTCTVFTEKKSGNWVWVCYNGVYGYAYGTYIK